MTIGINIRRIAAVAGLAGALAVVPAQAIAKTDPLPDGSSVCNTANSAGDGTLGVLAVDQQGGLKGDTGLTAKSVGNFNAAMHSRALAVCGQTVIATVSFGGIG